MASYSYAGLEVRVTADTKPLTAQVASSATKAGEEASKSLSQRIGSGLAKAGGSMGKGLATALGTATLAATAFGVKSLYVAAGVDKMRTALDAVAKANGLSKSAVEGTVAALQKQGLTVEAAIGVTTDFAKEHLGLANATKLSTVAQNAAVVSGKSVSDVMEGITRAVSTGNTRILRQSGIVINSKEAFKTYAESIGTTAGKLDEAQRSQAIVNAVMESGQHMAGAWAATLNDPARVLASFPRLAHDIQVALGEQLLKSFGPLIVSIGGVARGLKDALVPGGALGPVLAAIGTASAKILAPFTQVINLSAQWMATLKPGQLKGMTDAIGKFAPEIASIGTALGAFAGGQYLTKIPLIGEMFGGLGGPIGVVVTGLTTLALTSPQARQALGQLAATIGGAVVPVMKMIMPAVGQLGQALAVLLAAGLRAVLPLVPALTVVLLAALHVVLPLTPAITALANILAALLPYVVPLVAAWYAWTLALKAYEAALVVTRVAMFAIRNATLIWTAAQEALNVVLAANPIGIVVVALAALAGAIYIAWTRSATFRNIVIGTWQAIRSVVTPIITGISHAIEFAASHWQSILRTTMTVLLAIATGGMSLVASTISKHWSQIVGAAQHAAGAILNAIRGGLSSMLGSASNLLGQLGARFAGAWHNITSAAANAGGAIVGGLKSGILGAISGIGGWVKGAIVDPIIGAVKSFFGIGSPATVMIPIGINLIRGLIVGMLRANLPHLIGQVFGGFPQALAALLRRGVVAVSALPAKALSAVKALGGSAAHLVTGALRKIGGVLGFAGGGIIPEPVTGFGHRTGTVYQFAERGPELVSPLTGSPAQMAGLGRTPTVINVYPQPGQDERTIAAMVSRELAWAGAGGAQ